jgi:hypothetical protein
VSLRAFAVIRLERTFWHLAESRVRTKTRHPCWSRTSSIRGRAGGAQFSGRVSGSWSFRGPEQRSRPCSDFYVVLKGRFAQHDCHYDGGAIIGDIEGNKALRPARAGPVVSGRGTRPAR